MSETLDFPPLIDPAELDRHEKHKQAVLDAAGMQVRPLGTPAAPDLTKIDLTDVALAMYGTWRKDVDAAKANLSTLVLDLSTPTKIKEARSLRARLITDPLAAARKVSQGIKSKMAATSKAVGSELERIEAAYTEADALILPKIEEREAELAREREEKAKAEQERKDRHRANIERIRNFAVRADTEPGMTAERIATGIKLLEDTPTPTSATWDEFAVEAANAICETLERMRITHARVQRAEWAEAEAAELRAKLAEQERVSAMVEQAAAMPPMPQERVGEVILSMREKPREIAAGDTITLAEIDKGDVVRFAPGLALDTGEFVPAAELPAAPGPITMIEPAPPADEKPTLKLGDINDWLAPIQLTAAGLALLDIEHSGTEKAAKLYKPSDKARIKAALIQHIEGLA